MTKNSNGSFRHAIEEVASRPRTNPPHDPMTLVHGDFSPWNLGCRLGRLCGVLDFINAHVDRRSVDLACARRGYNDVVVRAISRSWDWTAVSSRKLVRTVTSRMGHDSSAAYST